MQSGTPRPARARKRARGLAAGLAGLFMMLSAQSLAQEVQVRGATHDDFSRVVYTVPKGMMPHWMRLGDLLILVFPKAGHVPGLTPAPRNILSVSGGTNQAAIGLPPGVQLHVWQIDVRVLVDVFPAGKVP